MKGRGGEINEEYEINIYGLLYIRAFPGGTVVKNLPASGGDARDRVSISGLGRSPAGGKWQPTPVFLPENFHGQEEPTVGSTRWALQSMGSLRVRHD